MQTLQGTAKLNKTKKKKRKKTGHHSPDCLGLSRTFLWCFDGSGKLVSEREEDFALERDSAASACFTAVVVGVVVAFGAEPAAFASTGDTLRSPVLPIAAAVFFLALLIPGSSLFDTTIRGEDC